MNVKTPACPPVDFLIKTIVGLDHWDSVKHDAGRLTCETHSALRYTSHALLVLASHCFEKTCIKYVLLGKFQVDCLEVRFGRYKQVFGAQYRIEENLRYRAEIQTSKGS